MKKRSLILKIWPFLSLSTLFSCSSNVEKQPLNVLFIAVDDLRPELNCYGVNYVKSPNIDKIAENGVVFTRNFCQSAVSNPSRASLLTGLRPNSTGVLDLHTNFRNTIPNVITLPQYFKNNGYHSLAIGKIYHNTFPDTLSWSEPKLYLDNYPFDPDAVYRGQESIDFISKRKQEILLANKQEKYIDQFGQWYIKAKSTECEDLPDNAYYDGAQTDKALEKLEELKKLDKPFFFGVGYYRPHLPFNVPKKYWDLYNPDEIPLAENNFLPKNSPQMAINNLREIRGYNDYKDQPYPKDGYVSNENAVHLKHGYLASVSYIDAQIGRLMKKLKELDLLENTVIVLWGDNGWKLGEHGSWCKMTNYGIDTRVPLIISTPETRNNGLHCSQLVEFVDVYPTLCELAGLEIPENLEGISLVPLLKDTSIQWKKAVYSQFLREGIWAAPDGKTYQGNSVRTKEFLYVE